MLKMSWEELEKKDGKQNKKISNIFNCGYGKGYSVLEVINTANEIYNNNKKNLEKYDLVLY